MPRRTSPKASLPPPPPAARHGVPRVNQDVDIDIDDETRNTPVPASGTPQFARFFGGRDAQGTGSKPPSSPAPAPAADETGSEDSGLASLLRDSASQGGTDPVTMDLSNVLAQPSDDPDGGQPPPRKHRDSEAALAPQADETSASAAPSPPALASELQGSAKLPVTSPPPPPPVARRRISAPPSPPTRPLTSAPPPPPRAGDGALATSVPPPRAQMSAPPPPEAQAPRFKQTQVGLAPSPFAVPVTVPDNWNQGSDDAYPDEATEVGPAISPEVLDGPPPPPPTASMPPGTRSSHPTSDYPGTADVVSESEQHAAVRPPQSQQAGGLLPPVPSVVPPAPASGTPLPLPPHARLSAPPSISLPPPPAAPAPALYGSEVEGYDEAVTTVIEPGHMEGMAIRHRTTQPPSTRSSRPATPAPVANTKQRNRVIAGVAAVGVVGVLAFAFSSDEGKVLVAVSGPNGVAVDGVEVKLDDKLVCKASPCVIEEVESGNHFISVQAEGYERRAPQPIAVESGEETVYNVELSDPESAQDSGLEIADQGGADLHLTLDGKDMGALPQKLSGLAPGPHTVALSGERYETYEQTIELLPGQMLTLQPQKLKVTKGLLTLKAGENSDDAKVVLDGKRVALPHAVDLDTSKPHKLTASRDGYEPLTVDVTFEDGQAERSLVISLEPAEEDEENESAAPSAPKSKVARAATPARRKPTAAKAASKSGAQGTGQGTLNLNAIPPALVILDGKPIGRTPKMGLRVSAGTHSVVFVGASERKRASTVVKAGATKTLTAKF